ncbi:helix-turn-helix domain-containing protein [Terricaulis sp.]|uniref:helix-turn-helix domain-containing protein n=1 Tax=Terricaulis sp. TaxID=2768686 RepID=UPI00378333E1
MTPYLVTRHAGAPIAAHRHTFAHGSLVLEGGYEEVGPEGVWRVSAGDLLIRPPFHRHANTRFRGSARVLNVMLPHAMVRRLDLSRYRVVRPREPERFIVRARRRPDASLGEALAHCEVRASAHARDWLDALADALRTDPAARIGDLAQAFGVTPTHVARAFLARFGQTPTAFRAEQRVRRGLCALVEGRLALAEVAVASGFADQSHLTRAIVAATGQTPAGLKRAFAPG